MLKLTQLLAHDFVLIQCHNIPDADSIASGLALLRYFTAQGREARLVYAGPAAVSKPNLTEMLRLLGIPLEYLGRGPHRLAEIAPAAQSPLLITADCQQGAGNVDKIECETVCVIDHHLPEGTLPPLSAVEPYLGSCCTVVWRLLCQAGFSLAGQEDLCTALYYGLYTDTNSLSELFHPTDRDMMESLPFNPDTIRWLKNNNLTRDELVIAGNALIETHHSESPPYSLFRAGPCDPNILGFISDLTMQAQGVAVCAGFNEINGGVKLSVRSCTNEVMANELAAFLAAGHGSGGGNREKAGGFLHWAGGDAMEYLENRLRAYFQSYDTVVSGQGLPALAAAPLYCKKPVPVGYVALNSLFPEGCLVTLRTMEGDAAFPVSAESYVMIGVEGECYPIDRAVFTKRYQPRPGPFSLLPGATGESYYPPLVRDRQSGVSHSLLEHARPCLPCGETFVRALPLAKTTKVFAKWYKEGYMLGQVGDYLAARREAPEDVYIINGRIFAATYAPA